MQKRQVVDIKHLLTSNGQINITFLKKCLDEKKLVPLKFVQEILIRFHNIIKDQPNVLAKSQPISIVGDIHGQFRDLLKVLSLCPNLDDNPKHTVLFLGDYVDRGPFGMQVIILLMAMKIKYKNNIFLLRGNHQSRQMTQCFNFYQECCEKYNQDLYFCIMDVFDAMPLACVVDNKYFCVHGGISPKALQMEKIMKENRCVEIPLEGIVCDLLWSDPTQNEEGVTQQLYDHNYLRNCSIIFGKELSQMFLKKNSFLTIIRAHEVQMEGFKEHMWPGWTNIPTVYTIFSAPNYCGTYHNKGSILTIVNQDFKIRQYKQEDPKYFVPQKFNAFNFTYNRLAEYVNGFCKRMAKAKTKQIPELKNLPSEQILALMLHYIKQESIPVSNFDSKTSSNPLKKQNSSDDDKTNYQKSIKYYQESQKRNSNSVIFVDKKHKKKIQ